MILPRGAWPAAIACLALAATLSACAAPGDAGRYARTVAQVQAAYRGAELAVAAEILRGGLAPLQVAQLRDAEAEADPVVAHLSAASSPATVRTVLERAAALQAALPPAQVPPDVHAALQAAQASVLLLQRSGTPGWLPPAAVTGTLS